MTPAVFGIRKRTRRTSSSQANSSSLPRKYPREKGVPWAKRARATSWRGLSQRRSTNSLGGRQIEAPGSSHAFGSSPCGSSTGVDEPLSTTTVETGCPSLATDSELACGASAPCGGVAPPHAARVSRAAQMGRRTKPMTLHPLANGVQQDAGSAAQLRTAPPLSLVVRPRPRAYEAREGSSKGDLAHASSPQTGRPRASTIGTGVSSARRSVTSRMASISLRAMSENGQKALEGRGCAVDAEPIRRALVQECDVARPAVLPRALRRGTR